MITESLSGTEPDGKATSGRTGLQGDPVNSLAGSWHRRWHPLWSPGWLPALTGLWKRFTLTLVLSPSQSRGGNQQLLWQKK